MVYFPNFDIGLHPVDTMKSGVLRCKQSRYIIRKKKMKYIISIQFWLLSLCQIVYSQEELEELAGELDALNDQVVEERIAELDAQYESLTVHEVDPDAVQIENFVTAVDSWIDWTHLVITLGVEEELSEDFDFYHEKIEATLPRLTERLFDRCVQDHDISQIENLFYLYQISTQFADDEASLDIEEKLQSCGQFRLEFVSELRLMDGWLTTMESQVKFEVSHETAGFGSYRVLGSAEVNISGEINYSDNSVTITGVGFVDGVLKVTDFRSNDGDLELDWLMDSVPQEHVEFLHYGPPQNVIRQHSANHWAVLFASRCNAVLEQNTEIPTDLSEAVEGLEALNERLETATDLSSRTRILTEEIPIFVDLITPVSRIVEDFESIPSAQFDPERCDQNNVARIEGYFSGFIEKDWQQGEGNLIAYKEINNDNEKTVMKVYH